MIGAWIAGSRNDAEAELRHPVDQRRVVARVARVARAGCPPSATNWSSAASSATTTCVGGVNRHCVVFSMYAHWSCEVERERRRVAGALLEHALAARTRSPCPAGPRRTCRRPRSARRTASCARRSAARRTSSSRRRSGAVPWRATTAAISGSGLRMPVDVSQWMRPTCVIDGSCASRRSTSCAVVGTSSAVSNVVRRRPIISRELRHALAVGAVDQHQHVAVARHQRVDRRLDRERAAALQRHADVRVARRG